MGRALAKGENGMKLVGAVETNSPMPTPKEAFRTLGLAVKSTSWML